MLVYIIITDHIITDWSRHHVPLVYGGSEWCHCKFSQLSVLGAGLLGSTVTLPWTFYIASLRLLVLSAGERFQLMATELAKVGSCFVDSTLVNSFVYDYHESV